MMKNGLFLISIGLIIFILSANAKTGQYDFLSIITAVSFMVAGGFFFFKGKKREEQTKKKNTEVKNYGSR